MNKATTTAIATVPGNSAVQVSMQLNGLTEVREVATEIAKSGIIGEITPSQGIVSLVAMREEGLSFVGFRRKYQWVGNELSTRPQWLLGEFKRNGGKYKIVQADTEACEIHFTTNDGDTYPLRITMEQMLKTDVPKDKNGNLKKNWKNFADDMLFARVCGKGLRRVAPELFAGVYTDGEAQDFDAAPAAPREIPPENVKVRLSKIAKKDERAERGKGELENMDRDCPAEERREAPVSDAAAGVIDVPASVSVAAENDAGVRLVDDSGVPVACPMPGKYYGVPYNTLASESPEIIAAILTCNREKHPELTEAHLAVVTEIAGKLGLLTDNGEVL